MTWQESLKAREAKKTNIEKLIDAAFKVFDENHSRCEGDEVITRLLEDGFFYNGHDYRWYAENLDLSECDAAAEFYAENEFLDHMGKEIWITRDKSTGEVIVRTRSAYSVDEWEIADKSEEWLEDILDCPRWS